MILTRSNNSTRRWTRGDGDKLSQADHVYLYEECGWACLIALRGDDRILAVHFDSVGQRKATLEALGYNVSFCGIEKMTDAEQEAAWCAVVDGYRRAPYAH